MFVPDVCSRHRPSLLPVVPSSYKFAIFFLEREVIVGEATALDGMPRNTSYISLRSSLQVGTICGRNEIASFQSKGYLEKQLIPRLSRQSCQSLRNQTFFFSKIHMRLIFCVTNSKAMLVF